MALGIVGAILVVVLLSSNQPKSPEGLTIVDTLDMYRQELLKAHEMTKPIFDKVDNGDEPSDAEKAKLLEAAQVIDNANHYLPNRVIPYLGAGKAYQFADQPDLAEARYLQCIANLPYEGKDESAIQTGYEAHYRLSQIAFKRLEYPKAAAEADIAIKGVPNAPDYLAAKASALVQMKQYKEAGKLVDQALALQPDHEVSRGLKVLILNQKP